ncbi:NUDIX hydrolase [Candidatus Dactylopiibacterium carminicum]|uniref:NUDIX hydrolase n=1 Tax=Candidatus Dactylopiibacterium carminicum TaxID=857335 RepID=UPI001CC276FF|nr:NUDIX domain-containing protein [Candidatus Dactylopiibacterium carminicum]
MSRETIICTVDVVLLSLKDAALHVALLRREHEPFAGALALPGGYVRADEDEDTESAAARILFEKTAIVSPYLEQLATFSGRARDPRGWSISVAYYALVPASLLELEHHPEIQLLAVDPLKGLPFDHRDIVQAAVARVRSKSSYSSLPVFLCGEQFTLPQLQAVYEALLGESINKVSFRRKMDELDILEPVQGARETGRANRPAQLYRLKQAYRKLLSTTDRAINPD